MFSRIAAISFLALPLLAAATPVLRRDSCNTGSIQCCNSTTTADDASVSALAGLLGVVLGPVEGLIGLGCSPISAVGVGSGSACNASPVCCENNSVGGLISIGCVPIQL